MTPVPAHGPYTGTAPTLTYTPDADYHGSDSFSFKVNDGLLDSNLATVAITISPVNDAPVLSAIGNQTVAEGAGIDVTATAADVDLPSTLTFSLENAPAGAQIGGSSGVFTWTPGEAQGPGDYTFTVKVCDNGALTFMRPGNDHGYCE